MKPIRYGQHPNKVFFGDLLAYPKLLVKIGFFTLIISFLFAYLYSRSEILIKQNATIVDVEFHRGTTKGELDSLHITYQYSFKNKKYKAPGGHYLPRGYPRDKVSEYVSKWKQENSIGSEIKIIVNTWHPSYSKIDGDDSRVWFFDFSTLFFLYWFFLMLFLTLVSMIFKYFFIRDKNDE